MRHMSHRVAVGLDGRRWGAQATAGGWRAPLQLRRDRWLAARGAVEAPRLVAIKAAIATAGPPLQWKHALYLAWLPSWRRGRAVAGGRGGFAGAVGLRNGARDEWRPEPARSRGALAALGRH